MRKAREIDSGPSALVKLGGSPALSNNRGHNTTVEPKNQLVAKAVAAYEAEQEAISAARAAIHDAYHSSDEVSYGHLATLLGMTRKSVMYRVRVEERRRAQADECNPT